MRHEIQVGQPREGLEDTGLLFPEPRAPLPLESAHDSFRQHAGLEHLIERTLLKQVEEIGSSVGTGVVLVFLVQAPNHRLLPDLVDVLKEHAQQDPARQAPLIPNIVLVGLGINTGMDAQNTADTLGEEGNPSTRAILHVNEELVPNDVQNVRLTETLRQHLDVLNGREGVQKGEGSENTFVEVGLQNLRLGRSRVWKDGANDVLVRLEAEGPKQDEHGNRLANEGNTYHERVLLPHPSECHTAHLTRYRI